MTEHPDYEGVLFVRLAVAPVLAMVRTILSIRNSDYDADANTNQEFRKQDFSGVKISTREH